MKMIDYRPEHFFLLELQESQRYVLEETVGPRDYADFLMHSTYMPKTIVVDNEVIAIFAVHMNGPHSGEITALLSKKIKDDNSKKYYYRGFKGARQYVESVLLYRLEARVDKGDEEQARLVKFLGLEYEATLEGAGVYMKDIDIYKRIRKHEYI